MVRFFRSVGHEVKGRLAKGAECCPRLREIAHSGQHVDDRLGSDAGNCGRADVVDASVQPWREQTLKHGSFGLETARPLRVVRNENDRLA